MDNHLIVSKCIYIKLKNNNLSDEAIDKIGEFIDHEIEVELYALATRMGEKFPQLTFSVN